MKRYLKWTGYCFLAGILAGTGAAVFVESLEAAITVFRSHSWLMAFLPISGLAVGLLYHYLGQEVVSGTTLIIDEIHNPKKVIPARAVPLVYVASLLSHLTGASVGREGAVVQIGASLSDQLSKLFKIEPIERKILLVAGAGAAFGAAVGAPIAGIFFGMEVISVGRLKPFAFFECVIASFTAFGLMKLIGFQFTIYPPIIYPEFKIEDLLWVAVAGIFFGLVVRLFVYATHLFEMLQRQFVKTPFLRPVIGGSILAILFIVEGSKRFNGLGLNLIVDCLTKPGIGAVFDRYHPAGLLKIPVYKAFFTAISVGSGFKGGEFVPLVAVGATFGSALAAVLPVSFQVLGASGFAAVFGGAANTPIACTIMAAELFGPQIIPYALVACLMSYLFSGQKGIYGGQQGQKISWRYHLKRL